MSLNKSKPQLSPSRFESHIGSPLLSNSESFFLGIEDKRFERINANEIDTDTNIDSDTNIKNNIENKSTYNLHSPCNSKPSITTSKSILQKNENQIINNEAVNDENENKNEELINLKDKVNSKKLRKGSLPEISKKNSLRKFSTPSFDETLQLFANRFLALKNKDDNQPLESLETDQTKQKSKFKILNKNKKIINESIESTIEPSNEPSIGPPIEEVSELNLNKELSSAQKIIIEYNAKQKQNSNVVEKLNSLTKDKPENIEKIRPLNKELNKPIQQRSSIQKNKISCRGCMKPIYDPLKAFKIDTLNSIFHIKCFRCSVCRISFSQENPYIPYKGRAYCEMDYKAVLQNFCNSCNQFVQDGMGVIVDGKIYHSEHIPEINGGNPFVSVDLNKPKNIIEPGSIPKSILRKKPINQCKKCSTEIKRNLITALENKYHRNCFTCVVCDTDLVSKVFFSIKNLPFCARDYHILNNSLCKACNKPIEGACAEIPTDNMNSISCITTLETKYNLTEEEKCILKLKTTHVRYHPECWKCTQCGLVLDKIYFMFEGNPLCEQDIYTIAKNNLINDNSSFTLSCTESQELSNDNFGKEISKLSVGTPTCYTPRTVDTLSFLKFVNSRPDTDSESATTTATTNTTINNINFDQSINSKKSYSKSSSFEDIKALSVILNSSTILSSGIIQDDNFVSLSPIVHKSNTSDSLEIINNLENSNQISSNSSNTILPKESNRKELDIIINNDNNNNTNYNTPTSCDVFSPYNTTFEWNNTLDEKPTAHVLIEDEIGNSMISKGLNKFDIDMDHTLDLDYLQYSIDKYCKN